MKLGGKCMHLIGPIIDRVSPGGHVPFETESLNVTSLTVGRVRQGEAPGAPEEGGVVLHVWIGGSEMILTNTILEVRAPPLPAAHGGAGRSQAMTRWRRPA